MIKHKVKYLRNSDTKNRQQRTTPEPPPWNGLKLVLRRQRHSQLLTWYKHLVGCSVRMLILLLANESSRLTNKSRLNAMRKQRRGGLTDTA